MSSDQHISSEDRNARVAAIATEYPALVLFVPIAAIICSETLLLFEFTGLAHMGHAATILLTAFAPIWLEETTDIFGAFALVSGLRLVTLGMPVFTELTLLWLPLVYAPVLPGLYVLIRTQDRIVVPAGLRNGVLLAPVAIPLGLAFAEIEYRFLEPEALLPDWSTLQLVVLFVVTMLLVAMVEELLFRGVLQQALSSRLGWMPGVLVASFIFGLTRAGYGVVPGMVVSFGIGVTLGILYDVTDSLSVVSLLHWTLNVSFFGVVPLWGPTLL